MQDGTEVITRKNLSSNDGGCVMCGSGLSLGGELFLLSLDVTRSFDQADMHSKQESSPNQSKKSKIKNQIPRISLNLDDS